MVQFRLEVVHQQKRELGSTLFFVYADDPNVNREP